MIGDLPPAAILVCGALLVPLLRGRVRQGFLLLLPLLGLLHLWYLPDGITWKIDCFNWQLECVRLDPLSRLFSYLFHIAAFLGLLFTLQVREVTQQAAALVYAGSAVGAVCAGDLLTLFVFWELLAVSSAFLIWSRRSERSARCGLRYLLVQVGSGVLLLSGIAVHVGQGGAVTFDKMSLDGLATGLIFVAFGIKCAFPLLHNWLVDAYPEATFGGTVFLSAFTTKVAVYALARGFPGVEIEIMGTSVKLLVYIGAAMAAFPIFYAVIENDLRRVLAYSMINQIGFMVCGIGIGTELAVNGAVSHAFNDVLFKGLLFMSLGAVLYRTGKMNGSELGGLYKSMPVTAGLCMVGAASISAFPLFSGFVSKSMVMEAALEGDHLVVWLILLFASAGVFHHAGIKIPYFAFFAHDSGIRCREAPRNMLLAMSIAAAMCIFNGCFPDAWLYPLLPFENDYDPYTSAHVISQLQILFFSALAFAWLKLSGLYPPELRSVNLDTDWFYRRPLPALAVWCTRGVGRCRDSVSGQMRGFLSRLADESRRIYGPAGHVARTWSTGEMVAWVAVFLGVALVLYYL